jgi:ribonuclease HII
LPSTGLPVIGPVCRPRGMATGARSAPRRVSDPFRFDLARLTAEADGEPSADLRLAGADEAGRGCLAGPLVAAAVVLDYRSAPFTALAGITDSKLLSSAEREALYPGILHTAARVSWVAQSASTIDRVGLHRCNLLALCRVLETLDGWYGLALVDGFDLKRPDLRAAAVIAGDYKSAAVAAASVVAKVVRDRLMRALAPLHPQYGFEEHFGYGTPRHREALKEVGPCVLHRRSFQGVVTTQLQLWDR